MYTVLHGDALSALRTLPAESVHCCVTSPPYWGLRDYGVEGQLGLERTPEEFVARLVSILGEVRRVLRDDGTLWLNLGDSYARTGGMQGGGNRELLHMEGKQRRMTALPEGSNLKSKDLVGIPWRCAFALQADGWYLRSDIIWAKPAPMPESVTDRPTRSHEYIFLLAKSERYYCDMEAIQEPAVGWNGSSFDDPRDLLLYPNIGKKPRIKAYNGKNAQTDEQASGQRMINGTASARAQGMPHDAPFGEMRNKRDVWTVNTKPFLEAHFATFPEDLIRPCILAGCPEGGTVLDPFAGACTTGLVAQKTGRDSVLIELNAEYVEMGRKRLEGYAPLFSEQPVADRTATGLEPAQMVIEPVFNEK